MIYCDILLLIREQKMTAENPRELILRPLGPQGPKVGIKISEAGDMIALDLAMGELTPEERKTVKGILSAAQRAGLDVIDCPTLPKEDLDPNNY